MTMICLNCGCDSEEVLCASCKADVDIEKLCSELIRYKVGNGNEIWDKAALQLKEPMNFSNVIFALTADTPSPRREYLRMLCLLGGKRYFPKDSRKWLYSNADAILSAELTVSERSKVYVLLLNSYFNDYRYFEAEEYAERLAQVNEYGADVTALVADYYIRTRRYELAEKLLNSAKERFPDNERFIIYTDELLNENDRRRLGRENGGLSPYLPADDDNRQLYVEFMAELGIEVQLPEKKEKKPAIVPMGKGEYPELKEERKPDFDSFVAFDLETTGVSKYDAITEIGAIRVVDGVVTESAEFTFQTLVKPFKKRIPDEVEQITGITNDMVKTAPQMWEAFNAFADFIGDDVLVGFNNRAFDNRFLIRAGRYAHRVINNRCFDVKRYAESIQDKLSCTSFSLGTLALMFDIENPRAHRALADAVTTARLYLKLKELGGVQEVSLDDMLNDDDWT